MPDHFEDQNAHWKHSPRMPDLEELEAEAVVRSDAYWADIRRGVIYVLAAGFLIKLLAG